MRASDARAARIRSLLLADHPFTSAVDVVTWLGALQAQDVASGMWSLGARLPGSSVGDVAEAFEDAQILRTWPMRGTIHIVPSRDARWMLDLTGRRSLDLSLRQREQLGMTLPEADRAASVLEAALAGGRRLTRAEALGTLSDAGIATDGQRGYHLLVHSSLLGVTCIGPQQGTEQTFVRLDEWAPEQVEYGRADALVELAFRYFRSHGPTTVRDFAGWTGLTLTDARAGVAGNVGRLAPVGAAGEEIWQAADPDPRLSGGTRGVLALPGFDELVLGYKDRSLHVPDGALDLIVPGGNGVFRATIVVDGTVRATWRRTLRGSRVVIDVEPFAPLAPRTLAAARRALERYADYLGLTPEIRLAGDSP